MESRKDLIIKLSIALVGLLLVLTFFSNTIHNFNIPGVVVGFGSDGIITNAYRSEGVVAFPDQKNIYAEVTGRISLMVEEGQTVQEGDVLFEIQMDRMGILERIAYLRGLMNGLPYGNWAEVRQEINNYQEMLGTDLLMTLYAPYGGVIRFIENTPEEGRFVDAEQRVMSLDMPQEQYMMVVVYFPESVGREPEVGVRRSLRMNIPSVSEYGVLGRIERIQSVEGRLRKEVLFLPPNQPLTGGERVEVIIEDFSILMENVLPNYAVREDNIGAFVLYVTREPNQLFGYAYTAQRLNIHVLQRGDHYTSFVVFTDHEAPIIIQSDRPIEEGDRVRVVGER